VGQFIIGGVLFLINISFRFDFTPFSAGPRNCIGQHMALIEAKLMTIYCLKNYKIIPSGKELRMRQKFLYGPADKDLVRFIKL